MAAASCFLVENAKVDEIQGIARGLSSGQKAVHPVKFKR